MLNIQKTTYNRKTTAIMKHKVVSCFKCLSYSTIIEYSYNSLSANLKKKNFTCIFWHLIWVWLQQILTITSILTICTFSLQTPHPSILQYSPSPHFGVFCCSHSSSSNKPYECFFCHTSPVQFFTLFRTILNIRHFFWTHSFSSPLQ